MESLHCLFLRLAHFEVGYFYAVLINFAARLHLVACIEVAPAACEAVVQQGFVVLALHSIGGEAEFVVLLVRLLSKIRVTDSFAVRAVCLSIFV